MKKSRALWWGAVMLGVLGLQAFHRHSAHDGGLFTPHEDCSLCERNVGSGGAEIVASPPSAPLLAVVESIFSDRSTADPSHPFLQPFGRAPPSSSVR